MIHSKRIWTAGVTVSRPISRQPLIFVPNWFEVVAREPSHVDPPTGPALLIEIVSHV